VLVIQAATHILNPTFDTSISDEAMANDPAKASSEYFATFRTDIESFVSREVAESAVMDGVHEIPPQAGTTFKAFVDAAGGSGGDSFTLGIAFRQGGETILAAIRERKPPFSPDAVVEEYAALMKTYGIHKATSDKWGSEFVVESFRKKGIELEQTAKAKSDIYAELLPTLNSGKARLLDNERLLNQLCALERKTARGGRDSIDHPPNAHDDLINAAAGALVEASGLMGDGFDVAEYIKAYLGDVSATTAQMPLPRTRAQMQQPPRNMAVFVPNDPINNVQPKDPRGDPPAIVQF
jgi:hypothetical protein